MLEQSPLLRVHPSRFIGGDAKEWCIEQGDIFLEEVAPANGDLRALGQCEP